MFVGRHAATARAVAIASFVIFLGSIPSLHHALSMTHPYKTDATLIDYTFCSLAIPPMLLGIKAGALRAAGVRGY